MKRLLSLILLLLPVLSGAKTVNPLDYGLKMAKTGEERYYALKRCHEDAIRLGCNVSYRGIRCIELSIPKDAKAIPLSRITDFAGVKLIVENKQKNLYLFSLENKAKQIDINKKDIDKGDFSGFDCLANGISLLFIQDQLPWINKRVGYNSSSNYKRNDVLVLREGKAQNNTIMPYNNEYSNPVSWYINTNGKKSVIKNLVFERTPSSSKITDVIEFRFVYNLDLENIEVITPEESLIKEGDGCFIIEDCAKITLNNIRIEGTYSSPSLTGYGVRLLNVYDVIINRMYAHGGWGVFGNYNVNQVTLKDCDINRFDVHYYGKDIKSINCTYCDLYNQYASVYGEVSFKNCQFINTIPVLIESSFNAYTPFNLIWKNCTFHFSKKKNYFITLFGVPEPYNDRPELRRKCLPNISIRNCKAYLDADVDEWMLVKTQGIKYKDSFDYIQNITMKDLEVICNNEKPFKLYSEELKTTMPVKTEINVKRKNK